MVWNAGWCLLVSYLAVPLIVAETAIREMNSSERRKIVGADGLASPNFNDDEEVPVPEAKELLESI